MPTWLTDHEHAVVAAAAERLIPAHDRHPGAPRCGRGRLRRPAARRVHVRPAADLGRRPVLRPRRRRGAVRRVPAAVPARGAGVAHPHRGLARAPRARVQRPGRRVWQQQLPRRRSRRSARTSATSTATSRTRAARRATPSSRSSCTSTRAKAPTARPSTAATATAPAGRRSSSRATCSPRGYTDEEVTGRE